MQEVLSFCFLVFNGYSMALLNAFQCASTVDMGMSSGGGGRKVCVYARWVGGGGGAESDMHNLQNFSVVDLEH